MSLPLDGENPTLDLDRGENPRKAQTIRVTVSGSEYDTLTEVYSRLGGDTDRLDLLREPSLSHNHGIDQTVRALVRGEVTADDFHEPFPSPESSGDENRYAKLSIAFTPDEISSLEERTVSSERDGDMNRRAIARTLRRSVIQPFVAEVTR